MSRRELWHPQVVGQIILLSLVASHSVSVVIPLVGRLALLGGSLSSGSSMRNSLLVWVLRVALSGFCCWLLPYSPRVSARPSRRVCTLFCGELQSLFSPWVGGGSSPPSEWQGPSPPILRRWTPHPLRGGGSIGWHHYVSSPSEEGDDCCSVFCGGVVWSGLWSLSFISDSS